MKNLLSIFIFFSFMSVANADEFIANKAEKTKDKKEESKKDNEDN